MTRTDYTLKQKQAYIKNRHYENGGVCDLCKKTISEAESTIDHITPLSKGGEDNANNMQIAHEKCNMKKGNHD